MLTQGVELLLREVATVIMENLVEVLGILLEEAFSRIDCHGSLKY